MARDPKSSSILLDRDSATELLREAYGRGFAEDFREHSLNMLTDDIQPLDAKGKRRLNPLLMSFVLAAVLAVGAFLFFTLR